MQSSLAIHGGSPVRQTMLPYGRQLVDDEDIQEVVRVLRSEWLTTGPTLLEFEKVFAQKVGAQYAIAVSSGTAALHAAVFAAGIQSNNEVITTPLTFAATANCIRYQRAKVVFADVRDDTLNLDPAKVAPLINGNTKAIITTDYAGHPSSLQEILALALRHDLIVIEDAAHALGATYHEKAVGSWSQLTTFSLHPVKQITAGEGGVVTTNDSVLAGRVKMFRSHGITTEFREREADNSWMYDMLDLGFNYRLTEMQASLGLSQLKKIDQWVKRRQEIAKRYTKAFRNLSEIEPPQVLENIDPSWHLYVIKLNLEQLTGDRGDIFRALRAENIGVNVHYIPVPWHSYYRSLGYSKGNWPIAEEAYERIISLPIFPAMTDDDVQNVISAVLKVVEYYRR